MGGAGAHSCILDNVSVRAVGDFGKGVVGEVQMTVVLEIEEEEEEAVVVAVAVDTDNVGMDTFPSTSHSEFDPKHGFRILISRCKAISVIWL